MRLPLPHFLRRHEPPADGQAPGQAASAQPAPAAEPRYEIRRGPLGWLDTLRDNRRAARASREDPLRAAQELAQERTDRGMRRAVKKNDTRAFQHYLARGGDPNAMSRTGNSAMHAATRSREADMLPAVIDAGGNPNLRRSAAIGALFEGETPLHAAVRALSVSSVRTLLDRPETDPRSRSGAGNTPLDIASALAEHELYQGERSLQEIIGQLQSAPDVSAPAYAAEARQDEVPIGQAPPPYRSQQ
jgi:hypothetical protein